MAADRDTQLSGAQKSLLGGLAQLVLTSSVESSNMWDRFVELIHDLVPQAENDLVDLLEGALVVFAKKTPFLSEDQREALADGMSELCGLLKQDEDADSAEPQMGLKERVRSLIQGIEEGRFEFALYEIPEDAIKKESAEELFRVVKGTLEDPQVLGRFFANLPPDDLQSLFGRLETVFEQELARSRLG